MKNADSQAFPKHPENYGGLTKREYFAGVALQGILAAAPSEKEVLDRDLYRFHASREAVWMADALLKALES